MADDQHEQHDQATAARSAAEQIVRRLVEAGYTAYFAGGCVRDRLMGHQPLDYDVATNATPADILALFPRAQAVGEAFGVMLVRKRSISVEVATFRTEGVYSDGRHPDDVTFSDAQHDAQRRDFTINGLFEDPLADEIIDYVNGRADIEAKIVRAIGDPHARLREDRLRMLRAVRFAARFGFELEPETADAIRTGAEHLHGVSRERVGQEVRRMLSDANRAVAAWEMQYLGLDHVVLQEPHATNAPTRVGRLPEQIAYPTVLVAWLLDRHEPTQGDFDSLSQCMEQWADALMLSNSERTDAARCLGIYLTLRDDWSSLGVARQKRLAATEAFTQALAVYQTMNRPGFIAVKRRVQELAETGLAPQPLISGDDLIREGLTPGPTFGKVLNAVYDSQLEGTVQDKAAAISLARMLAAESLDE